MREYGPCFYNLIDFELPNEYCVKSTPKLHHNRYFHLTLYFKFVNTRQLTKIFLLLFFFKKHRMKKKLIRYCVDLA